MSERLPDPALVVLVGASGSGKSTWARDRYRAEEVVSSDALRGVVGSGPHDLDASADAFALLETIVAARLGRGLTTVVDTLGLEPERRRAWLAAGRAAGLPAVAVLLATPDGECRRRNAARDRPVPAPVLAAQLTRVRAVADELVDEGWDVVREVTGPEPPAPTTPAAAPATAPDRRTSAGLEVVLQVSRFPWGEDPSAWLRAVALAADRAGFAGLALMDHLVQIPQVGRAWDPIPEPWVTLGHLAALDTSLTLGTLVTPASFRPAGIVAKHAATLDVLSGGRAFVGVGAGWWEREHLGFGLPFPSDRERLDLLESGIETMRALWGPGTRAYDGRRVSLPETTAYPRPVGPLPVIVGGGGERRTLRIAARLGDAVNVRFDPATFDHKVAVLRGHCREVGRDPSDVALTVLDLPVVGRDRDDVWARVERLRGRTAAAAYARRTHAGTVADHRERYADLAARGVSTVFVSLHDLAGPDDVEALAGLTR
ncbi:LLM class flavin-dependent oxidoreductase [Nocardioides guangzhouensis]|uniref:LLM class flavin-dependent oxidoreductase n=1 Tax=Nocardioides guangzhouensis TaxID=2497878 RepID=A0A4Q4ZGY6_9ACTN|nr:LLM class flavin-dependent oxidoreductase [Nocardioides guangzhouensis]RYP87472.1 LLM class flavin-dependent oxidoreductase [Nocardioides guangzhouensis]